MDVIKGDNETVVITFSNVDEALNYITDWDMDDGIGTALKHLKNMLNDIKDSEQKSKLESSIKSILPKWATYTLSIKRNDYSVTIKYGTDCVIEIHRNNSRCDNKPHIYCSVTDLITMQQLNEIYNAAQIYLK